VYAQQDECEIKTPTEQEAKQMTRLSGDGETPLMSQKKKCNPCRKEVPHYAEVDTLYTRYALPALATLGFIMTWIYSLTEIFHKSKSS
jgi:hypothetical protein